MRTASSGGPCLLLAGLLLASGCAVVEGVKPKCAPCTYTWECKSAYVYRYCTARPGTNQKRCRNLSVTGLGWCRCPDD